MELLKVEVGRNIRYGVLECQEKRSMGKRVAGITDFRYKLSRMPSGERERV